MIQFLAALVILHQDDLKERMNRITAIWWNGYFKKWMIIRLTLHQTTTKIDVPQKTYLQIILAANRLVWHSSTSPNQQ